MNRIIFEEKIEGFGAVGTRKLEIAVVAAVHAAKQNCFGRLSGVEKTAPDCRFVAEHSVGHVEKCAGAVGGYVGLYTHEALQLDEEAERNVGEGACGAGNFVEHRIDEIEESLVGLAVAQYCVEEIADEQNQCGLNRVVEQHDARGHRIGKCLQRTVLAHVDHRVESASGHEQRATARRSAPFAEGCDNGDASQLASENRDNNMRVLEFNHPQHYAS